MFGEISSGNKGTALTTIYNQHKQRLYRFAFRMLGDEEEAGDVVQTVFLRLLEKFDTISSPNHIQAWLFQVARNLCLDKLQSRKRETLAQPILEELASDAGQSSIDTEEAASSHLVHKALSRLSPELREILILREFQEFSYREIAEIIAVNESTVKFRLFTARRALCELLRPSLKGA